MKTLAKIYDALYSGWEAKITRKIIAVSLIVIFLCSVIMVELKHLGFIPANLSKNIPDNSLAPITFIFTLLLCIEIIDLLFTTAYSFSKTLCLQLEILSLILLRNTFKIILATQGMHLNSSEITTMLVTSCAGIFLFVLTIIGKRLPINVSALIQNKQERNNYFTIRKATSLLLICIFIVVCIHKAQNATPYIVEHFFESVYTLLVIFDILVLLIAQYYVHSVFYMFRNSAFVLCTMLIRVALSASPYTMALLAIIAGIYMIFINWLTNFMLQRNLLRE